MIIIENGKITHVPDLPSDYGSPEWKAYDKAFDDAIERGVDWTPDMAQTYTAYQDAMKRKAESEQ